MHNRSIRQRLSTLILGLVLALGIILINAAVTAAPAYAASGDLWIDGAEDTHYPSFADALAAAQAGDTIKVASLDASDITLAVNKAVTVEFTQSITITGTSSSTGITLSSGSHLRTSPGATLTLTGYKQALIAAVGSEINDGTYVFNKNGTAGSTSGVNINGNVIGSADKQSVNITITDNRATNFYSGSTLFKNATLDVTSGEWTYSDSKPTTLENASLTLSGFGQGFYIKTLKMKDSFLRMKDPGMRYGFISWGQTGMWVGEGTVDNSTIEVDYGSNAGISMGGPNTDNTLTLDVINGSVLDFRNDGQGGLNQAGGTVNVVNSTIKGDGSNSGLVYGTTQASGHIVMGANSLTETPAAKNADNGGALQLGGFVVTGGSHLIKYAPSYNSAMGSTVPTNGEAYGNESLTYLTLDQDVTSFSVIGSNGATYTYEVANASSDGQKHVWAPVAKYTVKLNNTNAKFADGTTANKTGTSVRGEVIGLVDGQQSVPTQVGTPSSSAANEHFEGWYLQAGSVPADNDTPFNPADNMDFAGGKLLADEVTIYAKWSNTPPPVEHTVTFELNGGALPSGTANPVSVLSTDYLDLTADAYQPTKETAADGTSYTFAGWYTDPNLADEHAAGDSLQPTANVTLYAKWTEVPPPDPNVYGDLLVQKVTADGGSEYDTEHTAKFPVSINDELNVRADVDARGLAVQVETVIAALEAIGIPGLDGNAPITNPQAKATIAVTFPEGLSLDGKPGQQTPIEDMVTLKDPSGLFEITDVQREGQQLTVTVNFADSSAVNSYNSLLEALKTVSDPVQVTMPGVLVAENAPEDSDLAITANISLAFSPDEGGTPTEITALQSSAGVDAVLADGAADEQKAIQLTLVTPLKPITSVTPVAPNASDPATCTVKPHVIIPASTYFDYLMDGKPVEAGTHYYEYGETIVVTAELKAEHQGAFKIAEGAQTSWSWTAPTLAELNCDAPENPENPENPGEQEQPEDPTIQPDPKQPGTQPTDPAIKPTPAQPGTQPAPGVNPTKSTLQQMPDTGAHGIGLLLGMALLATASGAGLLAIPARRSRG